MKTLERLKTSFIQSCTDYKKNYASMNDQQIDQFLDNKFRIEEKLKIVFIKEVHHLKNNIDQLKNNLIEIYPHIAESNGFYDLNKDLLEYKVHLINDVLQDIEELME